MLVPVDCLRCLLRKKPNMNAPSRTERIRDLVRSKFQRLGATTGGELSQTLMIQASRFCGHRFRQGPYHAVWFVEEDQIKFYGPKGQLLEVATPSELMGDDAQHYRAA